MKSRIVLIGAVMLAGVALAQGIKQISLTLAGQNLKLDSVVVQGKTYISLDQLKKQFQTAPAGGANQVAASEGCLNELLFNGVWRFRVQDVTYSEEEKAWMVRVELRNGTKNTIYAVGNGSDTGGQDLSLALASGNTLNISDGRVYDVQTALLYKNLAPGAGAVATLIFYADTQEDKPAKFLWSMKAQNKLSFTKDPAFRVKLDCKK
jgi:hypothetical protein